MGDDEVTNFTNVSLEQRCFRGETIYAIRQYRIDNYDKTRVRQENEFINNPGLFFA